MLIDGLALGKTCLNEVAVPELVGDGSDEEDHREGNAEYLA